MRPGALGSSRTPRAQRPAGGRPEADPRGRGTRVMARGVEGAASGGPPQGRGTRRLPGGVAAVRHGRTRARREAAVRPPAPSRRGRREHVFIYVADALSRWSIPVLVALVLGFALYRRVDVYNVFLEGAREGIDLAVRILPYVVSIFAALGIFRASGAMDLVALALRPVLHGLGVPAEVLPLMVIRPLSGSGALAITAELLRRFGPDSYVGRLASTMQGSTDTTFYILSVYFGSVGIRKVRHALWVGLAADVMGFALAALFVRLAFGGG